MRSKTTKVLAIAVVLSLSVMGIAKGFNPDDNVKKDSVSKECSMKDGKECTKYTSENGHKKDGEICEKSVKSAKHVDCDMKTDAKSCSMKNQKQDGKSSSGIKL